MCIRDRRLILHPLPIFSTKLLKNRGLASSGDGLPKSGIVAVIAPLGTANRPQLFDSTRVRYNVEAMVRSDVQLMLDVKAGDEVLSLIHIFRKARCGRDRACVAKANRASTRDTTRASCCEIAEMCIRDSQLVVRDPLRAKSTNRARRRGPRSSHPP